MTDGKAPKPGELEAFERLLDSYGSDRTRWPAPQRLEFAGLVASSPDAKRLYREAEALDRLLDLAPPSTSNTALLVDRIARSAFGDAPDRTAHREGSLKTSAAPSRSVMSRISWPAVSVLAASLVLGAVAGISGALDQAMGPSVVAAFEDGASDTDVGLLALDIATSPASEEDLL